MVTLYQLVIIHLDDDAWAAEVEERMRDLCARVLRHDGPLIRVAGVDEAAATDAPTLVVCLGGVAVGASSSVSAAVERARDEVFVVVPLLRDELVMHSSFPPVLQPLNALRWGAGDEAPLQLLRALGIIESERRLFLSYRQAESSALALQVRRGLSEREYDVFLDRFSVPPGDDFQRRIDIELADKSFVLLLESESAIGSEWVQHEVTYALSHHIPILALALPGVDVKDQFAVIDDAFRLKLQPADFDANSSGHVLTEHALARVLDSVEWRYARGVRRRREQLIGSAGDFLMRAGYDRGPLDDWAILATRGNERLVVSVTPRAPAPADLRLADRLRRRVVKHYGEEHVRDGWVVHDTWDHDPVDRDLVEWIVSERPLAIVALEDVRASAEAPGS